MHLSRQAFDFCIAVIWPRGIEETGNSSGDGQDRKYRKESTLCGSALLKQRMTQQNDRGDAKGCASTEGSGNHLHLQFPREKELHMKVRLIGISAKS